MKNLAGLLAILLGVSASPGLAQTADDLLNDAQTPEDVLIHSMGYDRKSYSPLEQIDKSNVHRLVPIWNASLMNLSGELAAPAIYDGVLYAINGSWTFAIDLETGRQLWRTPVVLEEGSRRRSSFNRGGPVIYEGRLFRVTVDNHILALDMETGEELWNQKFADGAQGYYATGAPIVANGVLISGMSGGESTTRGFLDGWDPATGEKLWRRYTIPGPGEPGHETWPADSDAWMYGGAPTWRSGSYDPELDLVYWGTGNAEPYDPAPRGALDSLYASSMLAIRPKTGEIACYYQYTPNDVYDVDGIDEHVLAELEVDGEMRKVTIQANKNGFLYVLDRTDCSLIAAHPYVYVNWATHIDLETGRPALSNIYRDFLSGEQVYIWPSRGTNAVPIAFNPEHRAHLLDDVARAAHPAASPRAAGIRPRGEFHRGHQPLPARRAGRSARPRRGHQSADRREEVGGPDARFPQLGRRARNGRRAAVHREDHGRVRRARQGDRRDALGVPDRIERQRDGRSPTLSTAGSR